MLAQATSTSRRLMTSRIGVLWTRTSYIDSFLYYLLPKYRPGTTFIEMEPGITNRDGTPLTDELRTADAVIVSERWKGWDEPNDSMKPGDPRPA